MYATHLKLQVHFHLVLIRYVVVDQVQRRRVQVALIRGNGPNNHKETFSSALSCLPGTNNIPRHRK
jgi:hypothetical protein